MNQPYVTGNCNCCSHLMEYHVCSCYFSNNIFLHKYTLHVTFHTEEQFLRDYEQVLKSRGCASKEELTEALKDVRCEVERRRNGGRDQLERCRLIKQSYKQLYPSVYTLKESYFEPEFLEAVRYAQSEHSSPEGLMDYIQEEDAPNTFSFPVFTREFCGRLLEELVHFESTDLPKGRPNTMNKGGLLLSELRFDEHFLDPLRRHYLTPLARLFYPDWARGGLDSHQAFVVKYALGDDVELSYHYDNAEVTLNVCPGAEFKGGDLYFGAMRTERERLKHEQRVTYKHVLGKGLLHRAQHMHGARPITSGVRYNLIVWMRSSSVRNSLCPMCNERPTLVPNLGYGDGFTVS